MTDLCTAVDAHLTAYGEPERVRRETLIARALAGDAELIDPPMDGPMQRFVGFFGALAPAAGSVA